MKQPKDSKLTQIMAYGTGAIFVLLPFHALLTTWAGANFGHIDLFRIWKELLLVPLVFGAFGLAVSDKNLRHWLKTNKLVLLIVLYILLHLGLGLYALNANNVNTRALIYSWISNLRFLIFFLVCIVLAAKTTCLKRNWKKLILWPALVVIIFGLLQQFILPNNFLSHFGYGDNTIPAINTIDRKPQYVRLQ